LENDLEITTWLIQCYALTAKRQNPLRKRLLLHQSIIDTRYISAIKRKDAWGYEFLQGKMSLLYLLIINRNPKIYTNKITIKNIFGDSYGYLCKVRLDF